MKEKVHSKIQALSLALSTVHTVHRLLTSTLNLDELLPRVARLCLQVLRSNSCAILLLDEGKRNLIPRTDVHLDGHSRKRKSKKIPVGRGIEGRVARTGNPFFKKDFLCVPLMDEDVLGVISIRDKKERNSFSMYDREILMTLAEQAVIAFKNARLYEEQEHLTTDSIQFLATILESKTPGRKRSLERLSAIPLGLAEELQLSHEETKRLHYATLLHDAGIISVPDRILTKPSKLSGPEYRIMQKVPAQSAQLVKPIRILEPVLPIILHHTERYDGKGYPKGLCGEEIPIGARILTVAKAFEAMMVHRPYRRKMGLRRALTELKRHQGVQFDPQVVEAFLKFSKKKAFQKILKSF